MQLSNLLATYVAQNRRIRAASTVRNYRIAVAHFSESLGHPATLSDLSSISLLALERYLVDRSPYTVDGELKRIQTLWRFAAQTALVATWPSLERIPIAPPDKPTWAPEEIRQLLDAAGRLRRYYCHVPRAVWWKTLLLCLWDTGERIGALRACRWEWLQGNVLAIPGKHRKGFKSAVYMLQAETVDALMISRAAARRESIWPWEMCDVTFYAHYTKLLKSAGLPFGRKRKAQCMRRSHLTHWEAGGHDASARAQHSSRAVTTRYYLDESRLPQIDPGTVLPPI